MQQAARNPGRRLNEPSHWRDEPTPSARRPSRKEADPEPVSNRPPRNVPGKYFSVYSLSHDADEAPEPIQQGLRWNAPQPWRGRQMIDYHRQGRGAGEPYIEYQVGIALYRGMADYIDRPSGLGRRLGRSHGSVSTMMADGLLDYRIYSRHNYYFLKMKNHFYSWSRSPSARTYPVLVRPSKSAAHYGTQHMQMQVLPCRPRWPGLAAGFPGLPHTHRPEQHIHDGMVFEPREEVRCMRNIFLCFRFGKDIGLFSVEVGHIDPYPGVFFFHSEQSDDIFSVVSR